MTVSIEQLTPEHQRIALEARAKIAAMIARCGLQQTVEAGQSTQNHDTEYDAHDE